MLNSFDCFVGWIAADTAGSSTASESWTGILDCSASWAPCLSPSACQACLPAGHRRPSSYLAAIAYLNYLVPRCRIGFGIGNWAASWPWKVWTFYRWRSRTLPFHETTGRLPSKAAAYSCIHYYSDILASAHFLVAFTNWFQMDYLLWTSNTLEHCFGW